MSILLDKNTRKSLGGSDLRQKELAELILTRRIGETLFFELPTADRIEVAAFASAGSQVSVGIEVLVEVNVVREEARLREACA